MLCVNKQNVKYGVVCKVRIVVSVKEDGSLILTINYRRFGHVSMYGIGKIARRVNDLCCQLAANVYLFQQSNEMHNIPFSSPQQHYHDPWHGSSTQQHTVQANRQ